MDRRDWAALAEQFVEGKMTGPEFERAFILAHRHAAEHGETIPYAMDLLFYEVDAYCADPALRGPEDIDEVELRAAAIRLLGRLDEKWPRPPGSPAIDTAGD